MIIKKLEKEKKVFLLISSTNFVVTNILKVWSLKTKMK